MISFANSLPKFQSIEKQSQFKLGKLVKKYKLILINSLRKYQTKKGIHRNHFTAWKGHLILSAVEKRHTLKNKTSCRLLKYIFNEFEVRNTICFPLREILWLYPLRRQLITWLLFANISLPLLS